MMADAEWIAERLPPVDEREPENETEFYGAARLIARAVGLPEAPPARPWTQWWQHGWVFADVVHPLQVVGEAKADHLVFVARQQHAEFLTARGYANVHAVGLPFLYADADVQRRADSLLVMPAHSVVTSSHRWDEDAYAAEIVALKPRFSSIVACVSRACVQQGYWTGAFDRHGVPWITGASPADRNALLRMATLFRSFEYVTTNAAGSHIAYAAHSGCKVSVHGVFAELEEKDFAHDEWYARHPDVLTLNVAAARRSALQARYPMLFRHPAEAEPLSDWGADMVGAQFRRPARDIAALLGWELRRED